MYNQIEIDKALDFKVKTVEDLQKYKQIMEVLNMKPNFSKLARELGKDRRTIKKYYEGYKKTNTRDKPSKIDKYYSLIKELLSEESIKTFHYIRHLWRYLVDNYELDVKESTFRYYINRNSEFKEYFSKGKKTLNNKLTVRYETPAGKQMQVDWKEEFQYITREGEVLSINVFVGLLSYSRYGVYHVTLNRKQSTLFAVLNDCFEKLGGVPKEILNDNMKTRMDAPRTSYSKGVVNDKFHQFSRDYGFDVQACESYKPNTKGKVESQMKLLDEIDAYQGEFTFDELVEHVKKINLRKNYDIHPSTGKSPIALFEYEKDFLSPLPSKEIRSRYYHRQTVKVNSAAMISFKSNQYSVPAEYVGKHIGLEVEDNKIYLYDNTNLIAIHPVSNHKLNYLPDHYEQVVATTMPYKNQEEVKNFSKMNLERISAIYDYKG